MSLATHDVDFLRELVANCSGNVIAQRQVCFLEQKLAKIVQSRGLNDLGGLVNELRTSKDKKLTKTVAEAVTINETSFFRDIHPFETLKSSILPELIKSRRGQKIQIWCAASSSGQEAYSIAMVCNELGMTPGNVSIVATDICDEMIQRSRSAVYSQMEVNRGLSTRRLLAHFQRAGKDWILNDNIRKMVDFRRLNLTQQWPGLGHFDLVFVRNVLIYFDQATKRKILEQIHRKILPGGFLFIGSSETIIGLDLPYQRKELNGTICYQPSNS